MAVPGSLARCIRVLIHWNTTCRADEVVHVYVREASTLRPERAVLQRRIVDPFEVIASTNDER
jgi:chorismate mutase